MPDEIELGPGAAPVKIERPGRFSKKEPAKEPVTQPAPSVGPIQGPAEPPKPSFRERVKTRYETSRQKRAIAKTPEARRERITKRKERVELKQQELDIRRTERKQRIRGITESRLGYTGSVAIRASKPAIETFRRAERRGLMIDPRTAYSSGLSGITPAQRYGVIRPGISTPRIQPTTSLPIYSMSSIGSGGLISRFEPQRMERQSIPRGIIKSYWSKKVKSLAKANIRKYGPDEGIARTIQLAEELGWKMQ